SAAVQRSADGGDELGDRYFAVAVRIAGAADVDRRRAERDVHARDELADRYLTVAVAVAWTGSLRRCGRGCGRRRRRLHVADRDHDRRQRGGVAVDRGRRIDAVSSAEQHVLAGRRRRDPGELPARLVVLFDVLRPGVGQLGSLTAGGPQQLFLLSIN